jgi:hypothetical protein
MLKLSARALPLVLCGACALPAVAAAAPQAVMCGSRITRDAVLRTDLECPDGATPAITVAANGVTVDLGGHVVQRGFGTVLSAEGVNRVTVRNGQLFTQGLALTASGHGDRFVDVVASGDLGGLSLHDGHDNTIVRGEAGVGVPSRSSFGGIGLKNERWDRIEGMNDTADLRLTASRHVHVTGSQIHEGVSVDTASRRNAIATSAISTFEFSAPALVVQGAQNRFVGDTVTLSPFASSDTPVVRIAGLGNHLTGNTASGGPFDGIDVLAPGNRLLGNVTRDNAALGINAVARTIDGGGNRASGNGDARQCVGVRCVP